MNLKRSFQILFLSGSLLIIQSSVYAGENAEIGGVFSIFYVSMDNNTGEYSAEIYPVASIKNNKYSDATLILDDKTKKTNKISVFDYFKEFTIIYDGAFLGKFIVDKVTPSTFQCSYALTGKGKLKGKTLKTFYESLNDTNSSLESGFGDDQRWDYKRKWTIAVAGGIKPPSHLQKLNKLDVDKFKNDLLHISKRTISKMENCTSCSDENIKLDLIKFSTVDINHDGIPEIVGKIKSIVKTRYFT